MEELVNTFLKSTGQDEKSSPARSSLITIEISNRNSNIVGDSIDDEET